jgi:hypothetical protein
MRRLEWVRSSRTETENKALCLSLCLLLRTAAQSPIQIEWRTQRETAHRFPHHAKVLGGSVQFNSSSRNRPIKVGTESSRLLIRPKINRLLGRWLALASMACLLANSVPVDGFGWRVRDRWVDAE